MLKSEWEEGRGGRDEVRGREGKGERTRGRKWEEMRNTRKEIKWRV